MANKVNANKDIKEDINELKIMVEILKRQIANLEARLQPQPLYTAEEYLEIARARNESKHMANK